MAKYTVIKKINGIDKEVTKVDTFKEGEYVCLCLNKRGMNTRIMLTSVWKKEALA